jgi:hypothetical protein
VKPWGHAGPAEACRLRCPSACSARAELIAGAPTGYRRQIADGGLGYFTDGTVLRSFLILRAGLAIAEALAKHAQGRKVEAGGVDSLPGLGRAVAQAWEIAAGPGGAADKAVALARMHPLVQAGEALGRTAGELCSGKATPLEVVNRINPAARAVEAVAKAHVAAERGRWQDVVGHVVDAGGHGGYGVRAGRWWRGRGQGAQARGGPGGCEGGREGRSCGGCGVGGRCRRGSREGGHL